MKEEDLTPGAASEVRVCDLAYRAIYTELLNPAEWVEHAAEMHPNSRVRGHVVRAEVSHADYLRLAEPVDNVTAVVALETWRPARPLALLVVQVEGTRYRCAVPLWNAEGRSWLREALKSGRCTIAVESTTVPAAAVLGFAVDIGLAVRSWLDAQEVSQGDCIVADEELYDLAWRLAIQETLPAETNLPPASDHRVLIAARGNVPMKIASRFAAWALQAMVLRTEDGEPR